MNQWEARIVYTPGMVSNTIYLSRIAYQGAREYLRADDTIITVERGKLTEEKDIVFTRLDDDQLTALLVALDAKGVKHPDAGFTEGKLEATERHLDDMRRIVGHVKKIPLGESK